jgi:hypothetical protein
MSYRNPQQYIDTQSMQIQQNLQRTLSGVGTKLVSDVNKIHKENAKKVEEIRAAADTRVEKAQNSIIQTQSKNPTTDFGDLQPQLSRMNAILLKDPTKRTAKEKSFVTSMSSIGDTMANSLKNTAMAQEAILEQVDKIPGTPGAIAADEDPELYAKLSVLANRTPGRTVAKYKTNENGQVVFSMDVYGEINGKEKFLGNIINDNVSTTQMPGIIPDITKDMSSSIKQTINSEDFTSKFGAFINEQGAMVFTKDGKSKGAKVTEEYFKKQLKPNAKNILLGLTPREKTRLYNNTLDKGDKADFDYNESWNDDKQSLIEEALMNSLIRETKETYPIFAKTVDLTEKKGSDKTIPEDYSNIIESWDSNIADDKPENFVNQDISINGSKKTISAASIDPESNELTLSYKSGANDDTRRKSYKLDDNNIHILYKALAGGYNTSFSKSIIAKALKTRKNIKKDPTSKTTDKAFSGGNFFNATTGAIDQRYPSGGGVLKND